MRSGIGGWRHKGATVTMTAALTLLLAAGRARADGVSLTAAPSQPQASSGIAAAIISSVHQVAKSAQKLIIDLGNDAALDAQYRSPFLTPRLDPVASDGGWGASENGAENGDWLISADSMNLSADADLSAICAASLSANTSLALAPSLSNPYAGYVLHDPTFAAITGGNVAWGGPIARSCNAAETSAGDLQLLGNISDTYAGGAAIDGWGSLALSESRVLGNGVNGFTLGDGPTSGNLQLGASTDLLAPKAVTWNAGGGISTQLTSRVTFYADYNAALPPRSFWSQTVSAGLDYKF